MSRYEIIRQRPPTFLDRVRSIWLGPFNTKDKRLKELGWFGTPVSSGVYVDEQSALSYSAVWSAVTLVSDDIASLPLHLYKRLPSGGKDRFEDHPLYRLLHDAPNPEMGTMVWRRTMQAHVMLWGNAYAEIERDNSSRPIAIWPLVPERVAVKREAGNLTYLVQNESGRTVAIDPENMVHLVGPSHDGSVGANVIAKARASFGLGLAAETFGGSFFGNGATFGGVISYPGNRPPEMQEKAYRDQLEARHQGVERAYRILALYNDAKFTQMGGVKPNEGQFNETRIFQIREVARWFKIPPHKLGDLADATYSNVEQMDAAYMSSCIRPWLVLWQQQLSRKLIPKLERRIQFIEHDTHGFLSVDAAARAALYATEHNVGSITPNEIRGYENRDPIAGGDRAFVQMAMIPLDKVDAYWDAQIDALKKPAEPPPPPPRTDGEDDRAITAFIERMEQQLHEDRAIKAALVADLESRLATATQTIADRDATIATVTHDCDIQRQRGDEWEKAFGAVAEDKRTLTETVEVLKADRSAARADAAKYSETAGEYAVLAKNVERERDDLIDRLNRGQLMHATEADEAAEMIEAMRKRATAAEEGMLAAVGARVEAEQERDAAVQLAEQADRARALAEEAQLAALNLAAQRQQESADRLTRMIAATRGLMVDAMGRVIRRETEKARRNQATPDKLRAWMRTFYVLHEETSIEMLQPAITAHLSLVGSEEQAGDATTALVRAHIAESQQQLEAVAAAEGTEFPVALAKLLNRWDTQRADAVADRLLKEEVSHVRRYA